MKPQLADTLDSLGQGGDPSEPVLVGSLVLSQKGSDVSTEANGGSGNRRNGHGFALIRSSDCDVVEVNVSVKSSLLWRRMGCITKNYQVFCMIWCGSRSAKKGDLWKERASG